jgi:tagaturonate reductase
MELNKFNHDKIKKTLASPWKAIHFWERRVKLLDAVHTALCPVSILYGSQTVREAIEDSYINMFVEDMLYGEILPVLSIDEDEKRKFAHDVLEKFRNPGNNHLFSSIALNAISKFKVRNLPSLLEYHKSYGVPPRNLTFAMAALIVFYKGVFNGKPVPVNDDARVLEFFRNVWKYDHKEVAKTVLSNTTLWGANLTTLPGFMEMIAECMEAIDKYGIEEGYNLLFFMEDLHEFA